MAAGGAPLEATGLEVTVSGAVWYWRGPAPYHFVTVPDEPSAAIRGIASEVTYGWGMIPARARLGATTWTTALWPKDGGYVVPLKDAVRAAEDVAVGDMVTVELVVSGAPGPRARRPPFG